MSNRVLMLPLLFLLALLLSASIQVDAECCGTGSYIKDQDGAFKCGDFTEPTPCCGVGSCNIFCCNCDDGCRNEPPGWQDFQNGDGKVKWAWNCDFPGHDILNRQIPGERCGELCKATNNCNAFSHFHGTCYLKQINGIGDKQSAEGGICGFLPWKFAGKK